MVIDICEDDSLFSHHHLHELLVVDLTVTIDIGLTDQLIDLVVGQLLSQVGHDVTQLGGGDETVAIAVEDLLSERKISSEVINKEKKKVRIFISLRTKVIIN